MSQDEGTVALERLQRWLLTAVSAPDGLDQGLERARTQDGRELDEVILPSRRVSAADRLRIYSNMYYSRLVEILCEDFPAVTAALGRDAETVFRDYLDRHPSTNQRLTPLGRHLPVYFLEDQADLASAHFLAALANLEHTRELVFEGGRSTLLDPATLAAMPPNAWPRARLSFVAASALIRSEWPVNDYLEAVLSGSDASVPTPRIQRILVWRKDYRVRRLVVSPSQFAILQSLRDGRTLMDAIGAGFDAAESDADAVPEDPESIAASLGEWFRTWAEAGVFGALAVDG